MRIMAPGGQFFGDEGGDQARDISVETGDFPNQAGGGKGEFFTCHDEDGFDAGDAAVGEGQLKFVLDVGEVTQGPDNDLGLFFSDVIDGQSGEGLDGDIVQVFSEFLNHRKAFMDGEEVFFFGIAPDGDDQRWEDFDAAVNHVKMTVGNGIKRSGKDRRDDLVLSHRTTWGE